MESDMDGPDDRDKRGKMRRRDLEIEKIEKVRRILKIPADKFYVKIHGRRELSANMVTILKELLK
jgi:hypothetical protein